MASVFRVHKYVVHLFPTQVTKKELGRWGPPGLKSPILWGGLFFGVMFGDGPIFNGIFLRVFEGGSKFPILRKLTSEGSLDNKGVRFGRFFLRNG